MEWIDANENPPTAYDDYVCLVRGKMAVATLREYLYDVKRPNWSVEGVTHYLKDVPLPPYEGSR
jgi:hypothetical protein